MNKMEMPKRAGTPDDVRVERVTALLLNYPRLDEQEVAEVKEFLSKGPILAIGWVTGNESLAPSLLAFKRDHPTLGKPSHFQHLVIGVTICLVLAVIGTLLWNRGT